MPQFMKFWRPKKKEKKVIPRSTSRAHAKKEYSESIVCFSFGCVLHFLIWYVHPFICSGNYCHYPQPLYITNKHSLKFPSPLNSCCTTFAMSQEHCRQVTHIFRGITLWCSVVLHLSGDNSLNPGPLATNIRVCLLNDRSLRYIALAFNDNIP